MSADHPITPPPELRRQWLDNDDFPFVDGTNNLLSITKDRLNSVMDQAARWGADQELEACCGFIGCKHSVAWSDKLRTARRPKPPSLKELALAALKRQAVRSVPSLIATEDCDTIREALEALPND